MTAPYSRPDLAPETMLAADGKTVLRRFRVEAVIYARNKTTARSRLNDAALYLDHARITKGES